MYYFLELLYTYLHDATVAVRAKLQLYVAHLSSSQWQLIKNSGLGGAIYMQYPKQNELRVNVHVP